MSGFILQNFSNKKLIPKLPFGERIFIYFTKPYVFRGDNPENFIYIEEEMTIDDHLLPKKKMTIADLLIEIGFFKDREQYERQRTLYKIVKNGITELPYSMEILGMDDPGRRNIEDIDIIRIQDNIEEKKKTSPSGIPIQKFYDLDYGKKRSSRRSSRKRKSRKRSSRKRKSGKRSSRKRNNYRKSSPKHKFKYKLESSKYPKTEKFNNCVSELKIKSKHKKWPKSGSRRESMLRPFRNACLKKLNLKKSK